MFVRARPRIARALLALLVIASFSIINAPSVYGQKSGLDLPVDVGGGGWNFSDAEVCMMKHINRARKQHGLSALDWDRQLGYVARRHASGMASSRAVYHDGNMDNEITNWRSLGQNTGRAGGCKKAFWAFMRSSSHRANILGSWRHVGVGVVRAHGCVWVQQIFETRYDPGNVYHYP